MSLLPKIFPRNDETRKADLERSLMRREAKIGGTLFGPIPKGRHREFFCLDEYTWVWYEEWTAQNGKRQSVTTRYELSEEGVTKYQNGRIYKHLPYEEMRNLYQTTQLYRQKVGAEYQRITQAA